jgi:hypothetical protein
MYVYERVARKIFNIKFIAVVIGHKKCMRHVLLTPTTSSIGSITE